MEENIDAAVEANEDEIKGQAKRSIAFSILPSVIRSHGWGNNAEGVDALQIVQRAYEIAAEMIEQGDKL